MSEMKFQHDKLEELSKLLKEAIDLYRQDRDLALKHYHDLKQQLNNVLEQEFEMSQDGVLESELNKALKLVFESSKKLDKVIFHVTNVIIAQLNNESRERIADKFRSDGNLIPNKPVDFKKLQQDYHSKLEYEPEED